jgi:hypothetical protein
MNEIKEKEGEGRSLLDIEQQARADDGRCDPKHDRYRSGDHELRSGRARSKSHLSFDDGVDPNHDPQESAEVQRVDRHGETVWNDIAEQPEMARNVLPSDRLRRGMPKRKRPSTPTTLSSAPMPLKISAFMSRPLRLLKVHANYASETRPGLTAANEALRTIVYRRK